MSEEGEHTNSLPHDHADFARKPLEKPSGIRVRGFTTPKARENMLSVETPRLTHDDLEEWCERSVNAPVLSEHRAGKARGRVLWAKPHDDGRIECEVEFEATPEGYELANSIEKGEKLGFSWGARHEVTSDSKLVHAFTDKLPVELTITASPEFGEECAITHKPQKSKEHMAAREKVLAAMKTEQGRARFGAPRYMGTTCWCVFF